MPKKHNAKYTSNNVFTNGCLVYRQGWVFSPNRPIEHILLFRAYLSSWILTMSDYETVKITLKLLIY